MIQFTSPTAAETRASEGSRPDWGEGVDRSVIFVLIYYSVLVLVFFIFSFIFSFSFSFKISRSLHFK